MTAPDDVRARLLPCPFCGGEAELIRGKDLHYGEVVHEQWTVSCAQADDEDCAGSRQPDYFTSDFAVEAWNHRAAHADLPGEVRELVEAMNLRFTSSNEIPVERGSIRDHEWAAIKSHMLAREVEVERLREWRALVEEHNEGCEKACDMDRCGYRPYFENNGRRCSECPHYNTIDIPAHLSENSRG